MPEGDTILRTARTLSRVLARKKVQAFSSKKLPRLGLVGRTIVAVEARGKHLLIRFDDGRALHSHMRMSGEWHFYRTGERWQRAEHRARCVIEVEGWVAVCFDAPTLRLLAPSQIDRDPTLAQLGPDVLAPEFDSTAAVRRMRALDGLEIGEAIMDQRAVCGIGNIYKSESLFACRIHPRALVADLSDEALRALFERARRIMSANVRSTQAKHASPGKDRPWVYRRENLPCRRCGTRIERFRQGALDRSTYHCPNCQRL